MAIEIRRPPEQRGGWYVAAQAALFLLYIFIPYVRIFGDWDPGIKTFGLVMMGWGAMFGIGALVTMGRTHGWRAITPYPKPLKGKTLLTEGPYAYVRHPMYLSVLLLTLGYALAGQHLPRLLAAFGLAIFYFFKARREESFLRSTYPEYKTYAAKVKALVPGLL